MTHALNRRHWLTRAAGRLAYAYPASAVALSLGSAKAAEPAPEPLGRFRYGFNTACVRERKLTLDELVDLVVAAGYDAIEPWIDEIQRFEQSGGSLEALAKRCADAGLEVASAIGFAAWIVDDDTQRRRGLEQARRDMELVRRLGGSRIAAPPAGAADANSAKISLLAAAERYGELLEAGAAIGVTPQVEVWGFSPNLSRLGEAVFVAVESGRDDACVLPDVYHLYKGGSSFAGLGRLSRSTLQCFHVNDYPSDPPREKIGDAQRVYPGDGVAPLDEILRTIAKVNDQCVLSLELFNREYQRQDPHVVARTGLAKMKAATAQALK
ncbi:MAG: sugar phosphate isomerase/epimerase [Planctomycetales bacterium]|nr:sugar phosphate isomerase/epimerase [Planctomycetales bacterium]